MKVLIILSGLWAITLAQQNHEEYVKQYLVGNWKENQYERTNLNNFLYEMGLNWFKRIYVTNASWENKQFITYNPSSSKFHVTGTKGPYATQFEFDLVHDYATQTGVDLGELGGQTRAKARFESNKLVTHLFKNGNHFLTAIREMDLENPNHMIYTTKHIGSGVSLVSQFYRLP